MSGDFLSGPVQGDLRTSSLRLARLDRDSRGEETGGQERLSECCLTLPLPFQFAAAGSCHRHDTSPNEEEAGVLEQGALTPEDKFAVEQRNYFEKLVLATAAHNQIADRAHTVRPTTIVPRC